MRTMVWTAVGLILLVVGGLTWGADGGRLREQIRQGKILPGMWSRDVQAAVGEPTKITKTRTYWSTREDWVYGEGARAISLTFEEGRLTRITGVRHTVPR